MERTKARPPEVLSAHLTEAEGGVQRSKSLSRKMATERVRNVAARCIWLSQVTNRSQFETMAARFLEEDS
jgi:hypothetical protein